MAKTKTKIREERKIYCSGLNWEGDGSDPSACKFRHSMQTSAEKYKCSHCSTGQTPEGIFASADGIKKIGPLKALENEDQVLEEPLVEETKKSPQDEVKAKISAPSEEKPQKKSPKRRRRRF